MHIVDHALAGMMREACAIAGAHFVDAAFVIGKVEELAGLLPVDPVALAVFAEVFPFEVSHRHSEMRSYTKKVSRGIGWRHGFAAIRTAKAVGALPYIDVKTYSQLIKTAGRVFFDLCKEAFEGGFIFSYFFPEQPQIYFLQVR